ncbi:hypothetical protein BGW41_003297 [Actinomortierella wolfii]|nr:hypothetical protein BGW41_003297 [Actinomortierella wolfii]
MIYSSFYNLLPEAKEQLSHELSIFAGHVDAFIMLFFFSGIGAMMFVHWIMHRVNSHSSPGIEHDESIQYFMPPEEQSSHQRMPSHYRYSVPFRSQHTQYAPNPYYTSQNTNNSGKHDDDDDHGYHEHDDTESRYQDSEYVDDEVTSLLNNAFLQIGATPASQIEEAMDRRWKKEQLQEQQRQQRRRRRRGGDGSDLEENGDGDDQAVEHSDHGSDSPDSDVPESIEVVIEDPHSRNMLGLENTNNGKNKNNLMNGNSGRLVPSESGSSWSSVSSESHPPYVPANNNSKKVNNHGRNLAKNRSKSRRRVRDSGHFHNAYQKPPPTITTTPAAPAAEAPSALQHMVDAGQRAAAPAVPLPPPVHHTYQTFAPPTMNGKSNNTKSTLKGLPQYPYSNHPRSSEEVTRGTLRRTSFPRLTQRHSSQSTNQQQHSQQNSPSQGHCFPETSSRQQQHEHHHHHHHHHHQQYNVPPEQRPLLAEYGRRGSDPLTSSRHDILDHAATDDGEHTELTDIGIQTAFTIAIHKFPEGLITFLSSTADPCLGFSVFMALAVHNIIEGYLIAFPLYIGLRSRAKAFAFAAILGGLSQPIGALLGWFILRKVVSLGWQVSAAGVIYALVAGMMASIAVNGMWPQAVKCAGRQPTKVVPMSFFAGIAIMGACQAAMGSKCKT